MDIFQSFILGLVQGLTEFLPVSSSGHLILASQLLGTTPSLATELVFHLATLAAVLVFYRKKILSLLKKPLQKTTFLLIISTLATAPVAFLLRDAADGMQDGRLLPLFFTLTAVLLVLSDKLRAKNCNPWAPGGNRGLIAGRCGNSGAIEKRHNHIRRNVFGQRQAGSLGILVFIVRSDNNSRRGFRNNIAPAGKR